MRPPDDHDGAPAGADRRAEPSGGGRTAATARLAVYPGSFDPLTNGHVDIITRGSRLFERIVVAVLLNEQKTPLFSADERVAMIAEVFRDLPAVEVDTFDGLLVDYAAGRGAHAIVRGLRAVSDFEYEFQMALMNRRLAGGLETVFMMPAAEYTYISSRLVKEVFMLGGTVEGLVPPVVEARLREKRTAREMPASRRAQERAE
jgi:pantetheine-phosphate adenylyltransferase